MKIVIVDGRGAYKKEQKAGIRKTIVEWLKENGGIGSISACSKDTGIHRVTVGRHFKEMVKEQEGK